MISKIHANFYSEEIFLEIYLDHLFLLPAIVLESFLKEQVVAFQAFRAFGILFDYFLCSCGYGTGKALKSIRSGCRHPLLRRSKTKMIAMLAFSPFPCASLSPSASQNHL